MRAARAPSIGLTSLDAAGRREPLARAEGDGEAKRFGFSRITRSSPSALRPSASMMIWQGWAPRELWVLISRSLPDLRMWPASRAVITLHYLVEMPLSEVAAVLDLAPGTVKSRLAYGLAQLRKENPA